MIKQLCITVINNTINEHICLYILCNTLMITTHLLIYLCITSYEIGYVC